jgi:uroporphyrinogen III methyltransferase/synthase
LKSGKVYLTGGGCGDTELITLKALNVLGNCDVVIYDSLVSEELLQWTKADCEKIYVGKRYGSHALGQPEINALLVEKAQEGQTVVRLKGGDPYLFGRGGEEFLAVKEAGIRCEEIPGISSAIAVPAAAGIPVTHRGLSAGVTVVTGTAAEKDGQGRLKMDFDVLARLDGTLVILMGMHYLQEIAAGLMEAGKDPDTPCAVIMDGTTRQQRCLKTVLSGLFAKAQAEGFTSPAVIVIGAVAKLELVSECSRITSESEKLAGITVGVTGTPHFVQKLSAALGQKGAEVWDMGFMEIRRTKESLPDLAHFRWLVFTSPNGVRVFLDKMRQERRDLRRLYGNRIAVIGPGTAEVLEEAGIYADYMPDIYDAAHLAEGLAERILEEQRGEEKGTEAVFLRADQGSGSLPRLFDDRGIPYLDWPLYELTVCDKKRGEAVRKRPDYVVFGSAMGVRAYFEGIKQEGQSSPESRYVCIGERCGEELCRHTGAPFLAAREASIEGIVACLCEAV